MVSKRKTKKAAANGGSDGNARSFVAELKKALTAGGFEKTAAAIASDFSKVRHCEPRMHPCICSKV